MGKNKQVHQHVRSVLKAKAKKKKGGVGGRDAFASHALLSLLRNDDNPIRVFIRLGHSTSTSRTTPEIL